MGVDNVIVPYATATTKSPGMYATEKQCISILRRMLLMMVVIRVIDFSK